MPLSHYQTNPLLSALGIPVQAGQLVAFTRKHNAAYGTNVSAITFGVVDHITPGGKATINQPYGTNNVMAVKGIPCCDCLQLDPRTVNWAVMPLHNDEVAYLVAASSPAGFLGE